MGEWVRKYKSTQWLLTFALEPIPLVTTLFQQMSPLAFADVRWRRCFFFTVTFLERLVLHFVYISVALSKLPGEKNHMWEESYLI